jgi:hypothetical protein
LNVFGGQCQLVLDVFFHSYDCFCSKELTIK